MVMIGVMEDGDRLLRPTIEARGSEPEIYLSGKMRAISGPTPCTQDSNMDTRRECPGQYAEVETMCKKIEEGALPIVDADAFLTGVVLLVVVK